MKVEGEYRFVDCYLASQFQPNNDGAPETHWFLTRPLEMIYTHLPASKAYQFLDPPIDPDTYFALPYVCVPYFQYNLNIVNFDSSSLELVDDSGKPCQLMSTQLRMITRNPPFQFVTSM